MQYAKDIMSRSPITLSPEDDVTTAAALLVEKGINGVPVVTGEGRVVGILCQSDLIAQQKKLPLPSVFTLLDSVISLSSTSSTQRELEKMTAITVGQAMTPDPVTVTPDTSLEKVATLMVEKKYHTLPVLEKEQLVGVIGKEDILKTLLPS